MEKGRNEEDERSNTKCGNGKTCCRQLYVLNMKGGEIHRGFMNIWMPVTNDDMYLTGMEVNGFL